ncbi:hypothetical protein EVAR_78846_1 [Eumeta japonica]|uniref:Uncharacterized protein n=1 Tax=Eumeta variegata TaxID=151549 RepID=A0A4C1U2D0_EUMVA|nr:hypothetical protein EVAR_78846_1 [Eumeta japonica]
MLRGGGNTVPSLLYQLFNKCRNSRRAPDDWCKAVITPFYKGNGWRAGVISHSHRIKTCLKFAALTFRSVSESSSGPLPLYHLTTLYINPLSNRYPIPIQEVGNALVTPLGFRHRLLSADALRRLHCSLTFKSDAYSAVTESIVTPCGRGQQPNI